MEERNNVFTKEVNKIELSADDDKWKQTISSVEIYTFGTSKNVACKIAEINYIDIIKQYKNDFDDITRGEIIQSDHKFLIIR